MNERQQITGIHQSETEQDKTTAGLKSRIINMNRTPMVEIGHVTCNKIQRQVG